MRIAIIDDEPLNRLVLRKIINAKCTDKEIIIEDGLIESSITKINLLKPDIVLLDIELKNGTGFDIIDGLNYSPEIIFTTAYEQYALQAIKAKASDYILKPIDEDELIKALINSSLKIEATNSKKVVLQENEISPLSGKAIAEKKFYSFRINNIKKTIFQDEIYFFVSSGSYTYLITENAKIILSKNIGEIEKELLNTKFYRTHNSFLINTTKIKLIDTKRSGKITLLNGETIPISQRKVKNFFDFLQNT